MPIRPVALYARYPEHLSRLHVEEITCTGRALLERTTVEVDRATGLRQLHPRDPGRTIVVIPGLELDVLQHSCLCLTGGSRVRSRVGDHHRVSVRIRNAEFAPWRVEGIREGAGFDARLEKPGAEGRHVIAIEIEHDRGFAGIDRVARLAEHQLSPTTREPCPGRFSRTLGRVRVAHNEPELLVELD